MSKISLNNLSDNLKEYLNTLGLSEEQVLNLINENGLNEEELKAMLKDTMSINELNTNSKTVIGAINELFQNANNGKEIIADAIGEPLSAEDTFAAMGSDINGLLSTFKTNMMNNGITVESGDRFKSLIDKIATMVEEGSGKGIQFAEGIETIIVDYTAPLFGGADFREPDTWEPVKQISINVGFKPMYILLVSEEFQFCRYEGTDYSIPQGYFELNNMSYCNINYTEYGGKMVRNKYWYNDGTSDGSEFIFDRRTEINNTGFDLFYRFLHVWSGYAIQNLHANVPLKWYAIGVGEEDTTLRDSLASILQEEGVDVTEEDDMASLIGKVDSEFEKKENEITDLFTRFFNKDNPIVIPISVNSGLYNYNTGILEYYNYTIHDNNMYVASITQDGNSGLYRVSLDDWSIDNIQLINDDFYTYYSDIATIDRYIVGYVTTRMELYDTVTNTATTSKTTTESYGWTSLIPYGTDTVFRFGGRRSSNTNDVNAFTKYTISTNTWTSETSAAYTDGYYDTPNVVYFDTITFDKTTSTYTTCTDRKISTNELIEHPYNDNLLIGYAEGYGPCFYNKSNFAITTMGKNELYSYYARCRHKAFFFKGMLVYFGLQGKLSSSDSSYNSIGYFAKDVIKK